MGLMFWGCYAEWQKPNQKTGEIVNGFRAEKLVVSDKGGFASGICPTNCGSR